MMSHAMQCAQLMRAALTEAVADSADEVPDEQLRSTVVRAAASRGRGVAWARGRGGAGAASRGRGGAWARGRGGGVAWARGRDDVAENERLRAAHVAARAGGAQPDGGLAPLGAPFCPGARAQRTACWWRPLTPSRVFGWLVFAQEAKYEAKLSDLTRVVSERLHDVHKAASTQAEAQMKACGRATCTFTLLS